VSDDIRVFVVDDEQPVLEGVRTVIESQAPGFSVAGTALNGRHALESIRSTQPDVILLDINMPGLSGIEVMRELRSRGIRTVCILVTAYERFDIAREAFGLGVFSYLLKPVTPARLLEVLEDARREVLARREQEAGHLETLSAMEDLRSRAERRLISLMVSGVLAGEELAEGTLDLGLGEHEPLTLLLLQRKTDGTESRLAFEHLLTQIGYNHRCLRSGMLQRRVFLLFPANPRPEQLEESLEKILRRDARRYPEGFVSYAAAAVARPAELPDEARRLSAAVMAREDRGGIVNPTMEAVNRIENHLLSGETEPAFAVLREHAAGAEPARFLEFAVKVCSLLYAREEDETCDRWLAAEPEEDAGSAIAVEAWIRRQLERISELYRRKLDTNPLIRDALMFVEGNFQRPFGLEDAAEHCGVTPQHLSKSFSQHMGMSFVDYLTQYRIQHAVELFRKGGRSIRAVAEACGYPDPNYFSRIFRRIHGSSPSAFLQEIQKEYTS
jgi:two-component system response regulator YesN